MSEMEYKKERPAILMLQDGRYFQGIGFGATKQVSGEIVFTTITGAGYIETLTDPSYHEQIVIMTHPLVGNYGVPPWEKDEDGLIKYFESESITVKGFIVNECCKNPSHYESVKSLNEFLFEEGVPGIEWIDTRALTKILRSEGVQLGLLKVYNQGEEPDIDELKKEVQMIDDPNKKNLAQEVSVKEIRKYLPSNSIGRVVILDLGIKYNTIRSLLLRKIEVYVVPYHYSYKEIMNLEPDGVLISNGPGDPSKYTKPIDVAKELIKNNIPMMGICLGNQVIGLAAGGESYKLKYGHRGGNKTVIDPNTKKCYITSQNHGYCVENFEESGFIETLVNIDDGSNEAIEHETKPILAVQFHPEASPGPLDSLYLFDKFIELMEL
ncbi:MAG: glutamine-hydrolyzing carbamoyl-phosphate synthase small subunit [Candidatus Lokiarchaeota archaeon]|nr:glutamine-hydrolyzing carbamoyl-phosphate synthase small subunit [Candidatus Lokiarchaeota archaeon]MBD3200715.1 glutamine-hydrolyzing carbamoyl-phosphate synthase small subunit [Candidatus Lokiarchaeota archaeon]